VSDDLAKTIQRLEQWVSCWTPHYSATIIADVRTLIRTAKASVKAVEQLQSVDRKSTEWGVVEYAIEILQEGQQ
jgi:hypothetical protein